MGQLSQSVSSYLVADKNKTLYKDFMLMIIFYYNMTMMKMLMMMMMMIMMMMTQASQTADVFLSSLVLERRARRETFSKSY